MKKTLSLLTIAILSFCSISANSFKPGDIWPDSDGNHINAHGGGVLHHKGTYYWYGEHKNDQNSAMWDGVSCYSSTDLYTWKREGIALAVVPDPQSPIVSGCVIERPKVVYNKKTNKFVMWFHLELKGQGYHAAQAGVAIADSPTGPFKFIEAKRVNAGYYPLNFDESLKNKHVPDSCFKAMTWHEKNTAIIDGFYVRRDFKGGQMARDMTLFVDKNKKAYHIFASEENATLHVCELSDDYLSHTGRYIRVQQGKSSEAPAPFYDGKHYWMFTSGCTGWDPNPARLLRADSMLGNWEYVGDPCRPSTEENASKTFRSQSTFVIPVDVKNKVFIYMGDRWTPKKHTDGRYIWLPVKFDDKGVPYLEWDKEWKLQ